MILHNTACEIMDHFNMEKIIATGSIGVSMMDIAVLSSNTRIAYSAIWFKTPSNVGPIQSVSVTFKDVFNQYSNPIRWALCEHLDKNLPDPHWVDDYVETLRYWTTDYVVSDEKQISNGTCSFVDREQMDNEQGEYETAEYTLVVPTDSLKPHTIYTLVFWPGKIDTANRNVWANIGGVSVQHIPGLVYIKDGSSMEAYQCYVDDGRKWDLIIPYVDNGFGWDLYN